MVVMVEARPLHNILTYMNTSLLYLLIYAKHRLSQTPDLSFAGTNVFFSVNISSKEYFQQKICLNGLIDILK